MLALVLLLLGEGNPIEPLAWNTQDSPTTGILQTCEGQSREQEMHQRQEQDQWVEATAHSTWSPLEHQHCFLGSSWLTELPHPFWN